MEHEAYHEGGYAEGDHECRGLLAEGSLEQESQQQNHQAVTCVAHTEGEEQGEEYADEGRGVESVVGRPAVHVGERLEQLHEAVVAELHRGLVLHRGGFLEPHCGKTLHSGLEGGGVGFGHEAFERHQGVGRGTFAGKAGQVAGCFFLLGGEGLAESGQFGAALPQNLGIQGNLPFLGVHGGIGLLEGERRCGDFVQRETFVRPCNHEAHAAAVVGNDLYGELLRPLRAEAFGVDYIEVQIDSELLQKVAVPAAPGGDFVALLEQFGQTGAKLREVGIAAGADVGYFAAQHVGLGQQGGGPVVHGLIAAGDVHHSQLLQALQEFILLAGKKHEGVFGHALYHTAASSSSSS